MPAIMFVAMQHRKSVEAKLWNRVSYLKSHNGSESSTVAYEIRDREPERVIPIMLELAEYGIFPNLLLFWVS